jgi:hypothetical protein
MIRLTAARFYVLVLCAAAGAAAEPIRLHPENGHYFLWRGRPTILVTSGEHYGAVLNLDFDFERYLAALAADGLNHTRTFSGTYREVASSFGITDNTLAPKEGRYICPWARSETPGYFDGTNKFDLRRWDPAYFNRLKRFVAVAQQHGIVVEMNLFCPLYADEMWNASPMNTRNNVNGIGGCPRSEVLTLRHPRLVDIHVAVTGKIVSELNEFDNVYFEVVNEPYERSVSSQWERRIAETIQQTEKGLPNKHLISMNIASGRKKVEDPHPAVSIFNFHGCSPPDTVAMNYGLRKVIGENETGFRGRHDLLYRAEGWDFIVAGGALYSNLDYSFTPRHPDGTFLDYHSPGGGSPALRRQLNILKNFMEGFDFVRMRPEPSAVKSVSGGLAAQVLAEPGRAYAIYLHVPIAWKPKTVEELAGTQVSTTLVLDLPAGTYRAEWVDTKDGGVAATETFDHAGASRPLESPTFVTDIALRVVAARQQQ